MLGYHGCEAEYGRAVVRGEVDLIPSDNEYDWLGPGVYFWQSDPRRALEWARERRGRRAYKEPFVIGAVIDLGNCLDLTERSNIELLKRVHASLTAVDEKAERADPQKPAMKKAAYDKGDDHSRRFLDNAVMRHLHEYIKRGQTTAAHPEPFDSIIGVFTEGDPIYEGSVFREKTHCQIAVLTPSLIHGYFLPRSTAI